MTNPPLYPPASPEGIETKKKPRFIKKALAYVGVALASALVGGATIAATIEPVTVEKKVEIVREVESTVDLSPCEDFMYSAGALLDMYSEAVGLQTSSIGAAADRDISLLESNNSEMSDLSDRKDTEKVKFLIFASSCKALF